jgi:predicted metal-dependent peptidase
VSSEIRTKLSAARTRLILERPFIGALVMHLRFTAAAPHACPTIATDARRLYFNAGYVARLTLAETQFVLAHEALHCALGHFARRSHRIRKRWDVACDHAVNLVLIQDGMRPPPGVLANTDFLGLTAEEIYPLIPPDTLELPLDGHWFESSSLSDGIGQPIAGSPRQARGPDAGDNATNDHAWNDAADEHHVEVTEHELPSATEALVQRWQDRLASAAQAAMRAGRLSDAIARSLGHLIAPRVPWRALLARYLMSIARDDYSFQRSSRREGDALLPRLGSGAINVIVVLDTSGSIGDEEIREFASEANALKGQVRASLVLHACDEKLCPDGPWHYAPWDPLTVPETLSGGGGTRFTPVFEWIERDHLHPDLLLYFTDAQGEFPVLPPPYPVVWLVKGRGQVPWGERIQLN